MSRAYTFILNPVAGGHRGRRDHPLLDLLQSRCPDARCVLTSSPGDAERIARERSMEADQVVVAVGGDGTVHEVACGLVAGRAAMAVLPLGSGNDFAKMLNSPHDLDAALPWWQQSRPRPCDVGQVRIETGSGNAIQTYFINSLGIGFEAEVAARAARARLLKGFSRYLVSTLVHLFRFRAPYMTLNWNGEQFSAPQFLLALGNGRCAGGGFMLTPDAEIDDGVLELCRADDLPIHRLLRILPSVLRGAHAGFDGVHTAKVTRISIDCPEGCGLHADGEALAADAIRIDVKVLPGALRLLG